jgi:hypothetical protein
LPWSKVSPRSGFNRQADLVFVDTSASATWCTFSRFLPVEVAASRSAPTLPTSLELRKSLTSFAAV